MGKQDKKALRKMLENLEVSNSGLVNEQLYIQLKDFKEHKRLQKKIHDKQAWKAYCV